MRWGWSSVFPGKTFHYLIFLFLVCAYLPNTVGLVVRLKGAKQVPDTWKQMLSLLKWIGLNGDIRSTNKSEWEISFNNGSTISLRSVYDPQGNVLMKGVTREIDAGLGIIINEECNTFTTNQLTMAEEAISANRTLRFDLFNTDSIKQPIVAEMQNIMSVSMSKLKAKGFQQKMVYQTIKNKAGENVPFKTWYRRSNHLTILDKLKDGDYQKLMRLEKQNPERAKVAVWGGNGSTGKLLYPSIKSKHFVNPLKFGFPITLPHSFFKKYRVGIDEGTQRDAYAMTLWGISHQNRAIRLSKLKIIPPIDGELVVTDLVKSSMEKLHFWNMQYSNFWNDVRIRVETAGNGTTIRQQLKQLLKKTKWNWMIDKSKKNINVASSLGNIGSVQGTSQPILEERTSAKDGFISSTQIIFWNADQETRNEYEMSREENGTIATNGGDDELNADDYALIPEYPSMWANPPKRTFREELLSVGIRRQYET